MDNIKVVISFNKDKIRVVINKIVDCNLLNCFNEEFDKEQFIIKWDDIKHIQEQDKYYIIMCLIDECSSRIKEPFIITNDTNNIIFTRE